MIFLSGRKNHLEESCSIFGATTNPEEREPYQTPLGQALPPTWKGAKDQDRGCVGSLLRLLTYHHAFQFHERFELEGWLGTH